MMINRMHFKSNSMNMVHRSKYGTELWLGDYYAATNVSLLKQKDIKSGKLNILCSTDSCCNVGCPVWQGTRD